MNTPTPRYMADIPLSTLLQQFLEKNHREQDFQEHTATRIFLDILPEPQRTMVESVKSENGILFVKSNIAAFRFDLINRRSSLVSQINEKLGKEVIRDIKV